MEISDELKNSILTELEKYKPIIRDGIHRITVSPETAYLYIPIVLNHVIDRIRYNVKERRFDKIGIRVAKDDLMEADWLPKDVVYCDRAEWIDIDLPKEFWEK